MRVSGVRRSGASTAAALALLAGALFAGASHASTASAGPTCTPRTLVVSAMPVELSPLLAREKVSKIVTVDGRDFYVGRLRGHDVVLALTGIGPVNARHSTREALKHFRCGNHRGISAVVFSGVAGGDYIGDVTVPTRWTKDNGKRFFGVDRRMLKAARRVARSRPRLEQKTPVGDPLCGCATSPDVATTVKVTHKPRIEIGGAGQTTDPFSGRALPCVPGGGDVFGCEPCPAQKKVGGDTQNFVPGIVPFVNPSFFTGYFASSSAGGKKYVAQDEETAAVDAVATHHHVPFLGFRAVSDGGGDPLHLPGFPAEFFYYRQLAADNAALTTLAFLSTWSGR